jgi:hypothetical protein
MSNVSSNAESLRLIIEQDDANGHRMSRTVIEWFGLDNGLANTMQLDLVERILAAVRAWDAAKNPK